MIKILHFISDSKIGGAGKLLIEQISELDKNQFDITVALPKYSKLIDKLPCKIIECNCSIDKSFSFNSIIEDYKIIKKIKPDIVHSHGSLSSRIAAKFLNIKSRVFTRHCAPNVPKYMKKPLSKWIFGKINNILSTSIIAVSPYTKRYLIDLGCNEKMIKTIMNGCSPLRYLSYDEKALYRTKYGLQEDDFVVSYIARLEEIKGHKTLIEAAKICKKQCQKLRFFIVGNGSCEENLKDYATKLKVNDVVEFIGFLDDISPILNISHLNLNCSYDSETASLSLSEGMSLAIPCIASDVGGNPYMIKNEINGLLFPPKDAKSLANAIIRLYEDKNLYKKCSRGAYNRYQKELSSKIMCRKMTRLYLSEIEKVKH